MCCVSTWLCQWGASTEHVYGNITESRDVPIEMFLSRTLEGTEYILSNSRANPMSLTESQQSEMCQTFNRMCTIGPMSV